MTPSQRAFSVQHDEHNQTVVFTGSMRPRMPGDMADTVEQIRHAAKHTSGSLFLDFKKLGKMNNTAFKELVASLRWVAGECPDLRVKIITTSVIAWANRKFDMLADLSPNFALDQYDREFYPGQGAIENEQFIPVLRTQTKIIWTQEEAILGRHGLTRGMKVADICCGIGDFAVLVYKAFAPSQLVAVDHSKPSLHYARTVAREFGIDAIEYLYGDAAALLLDDDHFDFVTCRLSLQIFDRPELILKELYRICRPGGRVYLTNETYSRCFGEPAAEAITWTYQEASRLYGDLGMNLEFGTKMNRYLQECGFEDLRIEPMILTNLNVDPAAFAAVIQSWENYAVEELARKAGHDDAYCEKLRRGFQAHIQAVTHPRGFGGWPIWVASARRPRNQL